MHGRYFDLISTATLTAFTHQFADVRHKQNFIGTLLPNGNMRDSWLSYVKNE